MIPPIGDIRPAGLSRIEAIISRFSPPRPSGPSVASTLTSSAGGAGFRSIGALGKSSGVFSSMLEGYGGAIDGALGWARTQLGAPYAAVNPFRFGEIPWDGGTHMSVNGSGTEFTYPAGTIVYDCSGFAAAIWKRAGVDLVGMGATTTELMTQTLPRVTDGRYRPGDIVIFDTDNDGVADHCKILTEDGGAIHATVGGVSYTTPDLHEAMMVVRPG